MKTKMFRGYKVFVNEKGESFFSDTGQPTAETWKSRPCGVCKRFPTKEGHDPCIGTLENVTNACCGHGNIKDAYVQFYHENYKEQPNKIKIKGQEAIDYIKKTRNAVSGINQQ